jgi:lipoprotein-anchoring transpeptidase ErfK/SrfK
MNSHFTRRSFIKLGAAAGLALPVALNKIDVFAERDHGAPGGPEVVKTRRPFARVMSSGLVIREKPDTRAKQIGSAKWNQVLAVTGQVESPASPSRHNQIWYQVEGGGFAHSSNLQPVENTPQAPERSVPSEGFFSETFVGASVVRAAPDAKAAAVYRITFGTTFQVLELLSGTDGAAWYRISDGRGQKLFVLAETQRRLTAREFSPISPEVPADKKRVDVDLRKQMVFAYEGETQVFTARCATGAVFTLDDGTVDDFTTTPGTYRAYEKRPSRRMSGGEQGSGDYYDLPGVPWVTYFSRSRMAFHGAFWHNDYGRPRSHGCVNLLPEDANWIYRWSTPFTTEKDAAVFTKSPEEGTIVRVF